MSDFVVPAGVVADFYAWLWWHSDTNDGRFELGKSRFAPNPDAEDIELWIGDRLAFRNPGDTTTLVTMGGHAPAETLEARATLVGGKVLQDIQVTLRRDDRDFVVTLKGIDADFVGVKLPMVCDDDTDAAIYDRLFLYEELHRMITDIFLQFIEIRLEDRWRHAVAPAIRKWLQGSPDPIPAD